MEIHEPFAGIPVTLKGRRVKAEVSYLWHECDTLLVRRSRDGEFCLYVINGGQDLMLLRFYYLGEDLHANIEGLEEFAYDQQMDLMMPF